MSADRPRLSPATLVPPGERERLTCEPCLEAFFFTVIAFPHRDHVAIFAARGPHHHDQPTIEQTVRLISVLAIVLAVILQSERRASEYLHRVLEIQSAHGPSFRPFVGIIVILSRFYVPPKNRRFKPATDAGARASRFEAMRGSLTQGGIRPQRTSA